MRRAVLAACMLLTTALLSGCAGNDAEAKGPPVSTSAAPPTVSDDTGSITGLVVDDEAIPVVGADVVLQGPSANATKTDAQGQFTFNHLFPGEYTVLAQKLGFDTAAKKVSLVAGNTTELRLLVRPMMLAEPRVETFLDEGYVDLNVYTFVVGYVGDTLGNDKRSFEHPIAAGVVGVVGAMEWQAATPINARYMFLTVQADGDTNSTTGKSPRVSRLDEMDFDKDKGKLTVSWGVNFACGVDANCFQNNPDAFVPQIAYQQRTSLYTNVFYVEPAPADFTGLPG